MSITSTTQIKASTAEEVHEQLEQAGVRLEAPPDTARVVFSPIDEAEARLGDGKLTPASRRH